MLKVKLLDYSELPANVKKNYSKSYGDNAFILIYHGDELIFYQSDNMEPEDVSFYNDLSWIPDMIETAYKLGLKDGNSLDYLE